MADTILDTAATTGMLSVEGDVTGTIDATPMAGSFNTLVDSDWYAINLVRGHSYLLEATNTGGLSDLAIAVVDAGRNIVDRAGVVDSGSSGSATLDYFAGTTGTYYVSISAGGSNPAALTGSYQINLFDLGATSDNVLDTAATTASMSTGDGSGIIDATPMSGSFNTSLDLDWIAVTLIAGHHYTFSGVGTTGGLTDVAIDLRDANRDILNSQGVVDGGTNGTASFTYTATTTGTEYIEIGAGGSDPASLLGGYQVSYVDDGGDTVVDTPATPASLTFDPDTHIATATSNFDATPTAGSFNTSVDHDWYAVSLIAGHNYFFSTSSTTSGNNLTPVDTAIALRDANRDVVDPRGVVEGTAPSLNYTPRVSGTYYFDISPGSSAPQGATGSYVINAFDLGTSPPDTVLDTPPTTASLTMNGTVTGTIDPLPENGSFNNSIDHDWYSVNLTAGERYTFSAQSPLGSTTDFAISLMNANRTVVDSQGVVDGGTSGSTITFTAPTSDTYYLAIGPGGSNPAGTTGGYQITTTDNGPNHLVINLVPDASVTQEFGANYQSSTFWTEVESAASFFETNFFDPITVTIDVGWGEVNGSTVSSNDAESLRNQTSYTFSQIVAALRSDATSANDATAVAHLPTRDPGPGGADFKIADAEARALGLSTTAPPVDGYVGFATDWAPTDANFVGVVEHEISEVLGRGSGINALTGVFTGSYSVLDLFRYSGGTAEPSSATGSTYFSIDGGATALKTFSNTAGEDPGGDWASGTNDSFDAILPNGNDPVSAVDLTEMDVLGYDTAPRPLPVSIVSGGIDYRVPVPNGGTSATPTGYIGAAAIAAAGYQFAIEYIGTANNAGYLRASDASALVQQGLSIVSVYAKSGMSDTNADGSYNNAWVGYFDNNGALGQGTADAIDAINAARAAGQMSGAIYFDINLDPANPNSGITQSAALAEIDEYVREINTYFTQVGAPYSIGVYGAGATLSFLQADPSAGVKYTWLSDNWLNEIGAVTSKNLEQTDTSGGAMVGGQPVDLDTAYTTDFGQWNTVPATPPTLTATNLQETTNEAPVPLASKLISTGAPVSWNIEDLDLGTDGASALLLNGSPLTAALNTTIMLTAAQLAQVTIGPVTGSHQIWASASNAGGKSNVVYFTVSPPVAGSGPPALTARNLQETANESPVSLSSQLLYSDPAGNPAVSWNVEDVGSDGKSALLLNGSPLGALNNTVMLTEAQFAQVTIGSVTSPHQIWAVATDGSNKSNVVDLTVSPPVSSSGPPTLTPQNLQETANETPVSLSSQLLYSDPANNPPVSWNVEDVTSSGQGALLLNGSPIALNNTITLTESQFAQVTIGSVTTSHQIWAVATDGSNKSNVVDFTVSPPSAGPPTLTAHNLQETTNETPVLLSSQLLYSDPANNPAVSWNVEDVTSSGQGALMLNGSPIALNNTITLTESQLAQVTIASVTSPHQIWAVATDGSNKSNVVNFTVSPPT